MRYTVLIDGEPGGYGVVFPDLPGCTAMGDTIEAALAEAASAARAWTQVAEAHGESNPPPRELSDLRADPEVAQAIREGAALASVFSVQEAGRPVKANLSLDSGVLAAIDAAAKRLNETRSATVEILARKALPLIG